MKWTASLFTWCILIASTAADLTSYRTFIERQARNKTFVKLFDEHVYKWSRLSSRKLGVEFPCSPLNAPKETASAHTLTASNVKVVAAMGDSITAGTGITARTVIGLLTEYRGYSFSIGGAGDYEDYLTIANIIKKFEPDVKGYSTGTGNENSQNAHLNVAKVGAKSSAMKSQAEKLIEKMRKEPGVDFENDWKLITVFIGGNDLCDYCESEDELSPEKYVDNVKQALDVLSTNIPRAFVSLVPVLNISVVNLLNQNLICSTIHLALCRCAAFPADSEAQKKLEQVTLAYQEGVEELVESGRYDVRDDFTVVIQPFFSETPLPLTPDGKPDLSYFAPDCFHLSHKGHEAAATALWNNLFEAVGQKRYKWQPGEPTKCPTEDEQYFYTYKNSASYTEKFGQSLGVDNEEAGQEETSDATISSSSTTIIVVLCACVLVICGIAAVVYKKISTKFLKKGRALYTEI